jgi:hypothetical protein
MELDIAAFYSGVSVARLAGPPFEYRQQSLVLESEKETSRKEKLHSRLPSGKVDRRSDL